MKKAFTLFVLIGSFLTACMNQDQAFITLKGHILNAPSDTIYVYDNFDAYQKVIILDKHNNFNDTLNVSTAEYYFEIGEESTNLFLSEGDDMEITLDYLSFDETIKASGKGQKINNYLFKRVLLREKNIYNDPNFFEKDSAQFYHDLNTFFDKEIHNLDCLHLDSHIFAEEKEGITMTKKNIGEFYKSKQELKKLELLEYAPDFTFEDPNGDSVSLSDLRGKLVFINVWASWCNPCIAEIPYFKELQKDYQERNIHFVSISIDMQNDKDVWKNILEEKQMTGIQLIMDKGWKSDFKFDYAISGIPRFILIDEEGKFINTDAPRPSENGLRELLEQYL